MTTTLRPGAATANLPVTGAVMAGGRSTRLGRDKALLELNGEPLLVRAVRLLGQLCAEVVVIGPTDRAAIVPGVRVIADERPGIGPLGGIATALRAARYDRVLVVATDMPLLNPDLLRHLITLDPDAAVAIPRVGDRTQQLHAVYARSCLPFIDEQIAREDFKIDRFFPRVRVRILEEEEVRRFDPELRSFRNINTEADWQAVCALVGVATSD